MQQIDGVLHHWPMQGEDPLLLRLAGADPLVSLLRADTPGAGRQQSAKSSHLLSAESILDFPPSGINIVVCPRLFNSVLYLPELVKTQPMMALYRYRTFLRHG